MPLWWNSVYTIRSKRIAYNSVQVRILLKALGLLVLLVLLVLRGRGGMADAAGLKPVILGIGCEGSTPSGRTNRTNCTNRTNYYQGISQKQTASPGTRKP